MACETAGYICPINPKNQEMKKMKCLLTALLLAAATMGQAQDTKAHLRDFPKITIAAFKVYGVCGQCKMRILNAVKAKGIKSAYWDEESKILTVQYDEELIKLDAIHSLIAAAGYDTEKTKAKDTVYDALPDCCRYRSIQSLKN